MKKTTHIIAGARSRGEYESLDYGELAEILGLALDLFLNVTEF